MFLNVDGYCDVRHASVDQRSPACKICDILDMAWSHDTRVVNRHIHEYLIQFDILLGMRVHEIVVLKSRDRQNRRAIQLRVIQAI